MLRLRPNTPVGEEVGGRNTERLLSFSDGVFSIIVTLLAFELKVPALPEARTTAQVLLGLLDAWPNFAAFLLGFVGIAEIWANHVALFRYVVRTDRRTLILNALLLLLASLTPFATGLLALSLNRDEAHRQAATLVYIGLVILLAGAFNALGRYVLTPRSGLLDSRIDKTALAGLSRRYRYGPALYLVAFAGALASSGIGLLLVTALEVVFALPFTRRKPIAGGHP